jgi:hypothetical protein
MTVKRNWRHAVLTVVSGCLCVLASAHASSARVDENSTTIQPRSNVAPGFWILNQPRAKASSLEREQLWIVKDDGRDMIWVSVQADARGAIHVTSWQGQYDGPAAASAGGELTLALTSPKHGEIKLSGMLSGVGAIDEHCIMLRSKKHLRCTIRIATDKDPVTLVKDFRFVPAPQ